MKFYGPRGEGVIRPDWKVILPTIIILLLSTGALTYWFQ